MGVERAEPGAFEMVVDRHAERAFRRLLADHIAVEHLVDLGGFGQACDFEPGVFRPLLSDDVHAQRHAFIADRHACAGDEPAHFVFAFAAERTALHAVVVADHRPIGHAVLPVGP